jgi:hypothetical protein
VFISRRDPLLAEGAGFLFFFRISEFSGIFLGRELRQIPGKPPATNPPPATMNDTAEMQWRLPLGDQPILAMTGSFILLSNFARRQPVGR